MSGVDFVVVADHDGEYEVWTPDQTGACVGAGATPRKALDNALVNLEYTVASIKTRLRAEFPSA